MLGILDRSVPCVADKPFLPKFIEEDSALELNDHQDAVTGTTEKPIHRAVSRSKSVTPIISYRLLLTIGKSTHTFVAVTTRTTQRLGLRL